MTSKIRMPRSAAASMPDFFGGAILTPYPWSMRQSLALSVATHVAFHDQVLLVIYYDYLAKFHIIRHT
jgi:hypothetical protein